MLRAARLALLPDLLAGLAVLVIGAGELWYDWRWIGGALAAGWAPWLMVAAVAAAVGLSRRAPGPALTLAWFALWLHVVDHVQVLRTEAAAVIVLFGAARWGSRAVLAAAAVSIPIAAAVLVRYLGHQLLGVLGFPDHEQIAAQLRRLGDNLEVGAALLGTAALGVPWLAGLVLRVSDRAREGADRAREGADRAAAELARTEADRLRARQLARMRDEQTRLARDVHDVVGHSLAVILAQAESGQYLSDDDPAALKTTLATIATSARGSLQDIRLVLTATRDDPAATGDPATRDDPAATGEDPGVRPGLDTLIDGVRVSGHTVLATEEGEARPLTAEQSLTAFRVLQEMLTNAIRHGRPDRPIEVERRWAGDALTVEVRNEVRAAGAAGAEPTGIGLRGMRERLSPAGGTLDIRQEGETFVVTARVPV